VEFLVGIHAAGSYGTLPSIDIGVGGGIGLAGRRWRAELRGSYGLRRDQKAWAAAPAGAYGQFNFWAVAFADASISAGRVWPSAPAPMLRSASPRPRVLA